MPAALAQGISQLPASYGDRPEATLPPAMVPAAPVSPKTPALMKVAAIAGILSTLTGVIILVYFLFIERPATHHARRQGPDLKRLAAATGDKARTVTPELKPDAGTVKLEFPAVDVQRTVRGKAPRKVARRAGTPAAKVPAKADPASKLSAKERRLLAAMGGNVGGSAVPKARKGKGRSLRPQRQIKGNEIATLQRKHRFALKACYQRSLKRDNSLKEVRAEIRIDVGSSGIVRSVKVGKVSDFALRTCLSRTVKRWVFKPVGGRGTTVEFPLIFRGS